MTANFTGGAGGGSYTYAGDSQPADPVEGETWYDTGDNEAYVYDGAGWVKQTVTDHGEIGGVSAGQHRSDANIEATVHDPPTETNEQSTPTWQTSYQTSDGGYGAQHLRTWIISIDEINDDAYGVYVEGTVYETPTTFSRPRFCDRIKNQNSLEPSGDVKVTHVLHQDHFHSI